MPDQTPIYTQIGNGSNISGNNSDWLDPVQGREFDLRVLWQMLERHKEQMGEKEDVTKNISSTWELVVVQVCS
jgi:hypothetical protein